MPIALQQGWVKTVYTECLKSKYTRWILILLIFCYLNFKVYIYFTLNLLYIYFTYTLNFVIQILKCIFTFETPCICSVWRRFSLHNMLSSSWFVDKN